MHPRRPRESRCGDAHHAVAPAPRGLQPHDATPFPNHMGALMKIVRCTSSCHMSVCTGRQPSSVPANAGAGASWNLRDMCSATRTCYWIPPLSATLKMCACMDGRIQPTKVAHLQQAHTFMQCVPGAVGPAAKGCFHMCNAPMIVSLEGWSWGMHGLIHPCIHFISLPPCQPTTCLYELQQSCS